MRINNKFLGFTLSIIGLLFILNGKIGITGAIIGATNTTSMLSLILGLIFVIVGIVVLVEEQEGGLEKITWDYGKDVGEYQKLKKRLKEMEEFGLVGTDQYTKKGRYLKPSELSILKDTVLKYLPEELKKSNIEISVSGSLSRAKKGVRHEKDIGPKGMKSDEFWLSDIDLDIEGENPFNYIETYWNRAIKAKGQGRGAMEETYKIAHENYLNRRETKMGYMKNAPEWILNMLEELNHHKFAGENRPINIKFYRKNHPEIEKDVIYKRN